MKFRTFVFAVVLAVAVPMFGDTLPDKPRPQPRTADKEFVVDVSGLATAWVLDTISTAERFDWCQNHYGTTVGYQPNCFESGGFFNGTRDTAKIMGAWAAVDVGAAVLSYELKKHVHNKYLHPLWRLPLLIGAEQHTQAAIGNWSLPAPAAGTAQFRK